MRVGDRQGRKGIEAFDQEPGLIVGGKIGRADHPVKPSFIEPISGGAKKALRRTVIFDTLKETKEACLFFVKIAIAEIVNGDDSPDHLSSSFQKKKAGLRIVFEKQIVVLVDKFFLP